MAQTPKNYFRVACGLEVLEGQAPDLVVLPADVVRRAAVGDGILLAAYDVDAQTGMVRWIGLVKQKNDAGLQMEWKSVRAEIWVDTSFGRKFWSTRDSFRFDNKKIGDYGLHHLFGEHFSELEVLEPPAILSKAPGKPKRESRRKPSIDRERTVPMEVVGEPTGSPRGGYVYVLKSAYGYKVGRTRNVPARMRAFGVHLPFMYSIELCAWFDDHVHAESHYHRMFEQKRINGEWFDLEPGEVDLVRRRELLGA